MRQKIMGFRVQWLNHMQAICTLLQTDNHTNISSLNFYRPDTLPDAQPAVSKHRRQQKVLKLLNPKLLLTVSQINLFDLNVWNKVGN